MIDLKIPIQESPEVGGRASVNSEYLREFIKMHEYRLQGKINNARAMKLRHRLADLKY
jgi:hypothetical protein